MSPAGRHERSPELGPAYIKLGQVLASRGDLLPAEYVRELEALRDDVPPVPFDQVVAIVEEELSARIGKLFDAIDDTPLGSASLGQAHAAVLRGGREVVVKVQRPDILESLIRDIDFFRELARLLSRTAGGKRVDMLGIVRQLEQALADELDYRIEARNAGRFRRSLAGFPRLLAPRVIEGYSPRRVLTTERLRGIRLNEIPPGLALTGVLIASAMLLPVRPVLGTAGFLIAGALALYMVATIIVSDRRRGGSAGRRRSAHEA